MCEQQNVFCKYMGMKNKNRIIGTNITDNKEKSIRLQQ